MGAAAPALAPAQLAITTAMVVLAAVYLRACLLHQPHHKTFNLKLQHSVT